MMTVTGAANLSSSLMLTTTTATTPTSSVVISPTITTTSSSTTAFYLDTIIFINTKILFVQIVFGCGGNILNLIVLLSRAMRSRTNLIFAAMAFADLFFLILHAPTVLFFCGTLMKSQWYRQGFSQVIAGVLNWFSSVSIWCMMYATIERVQVIRSPFSTSKKSASTRFFITLFSIAFGCLLLTLLHFVPLDVRANYKISQYLAMIHMLFVVVIPLVLSTALNILLILALRRNQMPLQMLDDGHLHQSLIDQRTRTERKVTLMVIVILTSFIICNSPGAVVFVLRERADQTKKATTDQVLLQTICNSLTVTGKVLNFLLFCLSSEHFRILLKKRLSYLLNWRSNKKRGTTFSTTATKTFSVPLSDL